MRKQYEELISHAYSAFNLRDIDKVLLTLDPNVQWANGWEGGYVKGHNELRRNLFPHLPKAVCVGYHYKTLKIKDGYQIKID